MALTTRQPFAELGTPRLHALQSAKNRQNAIAPTLSSSLKQTTPVTGKRRAPSPSPYGEDFDSENIDPSIFNSPTKKSKSSDGLSKPSQFSLFTSPAKPSPLFTASPTVPAVRKAVSSPNTSNSTPINLSRGSPKHKRIGLLSKRRASSSPFKRVDPPAFSHSSPGLPFSIDAALKGSIPDYTPKATVAAPNVSTLDESMPTSWFFDIHEDTPEEEAANMMEHSASVLDISSDDDFETKRRNEELERGKENIPPPDFLLSQHRSQASANAMDGTRIEAASEHVKLPRLRKIAQDAMDEDRSPLSDLPAADFYGEGLDASSYVTVDAGIEKPSGLSKEFDFNVPTPEKEPATEEGAESTKEEPTIQIFTDDVAESTIVPQEQAVLSTLDVVPEAQEVSSEVTP